jgi:hypothetical protein
MCIVVKHAVVVGPYFIVCIWLSYLYVYQSINRHAFIGSLLNSALSAVELIGIIISGHAGWGKIEEGNSCDPAFAIGTLKEIPKNFLTGSTWFLWVNIAFSQRCSSGLMGHCHRNIRVGTSVSIQIYSSLHSKRICGVCLHVYMCRRGCIFGLERSEKPTFIYLVLSQ